MQAYFWEILCVECRYYERKETKVFIEEALESVCKQLQPEPLYGLLKVLKEFGPTKKIVNFLILNSSSLRLFLMTLFSSWTIQHSDKLTRIMSRLNIIPLPDFLIGILSGKEEENSKI